MKLNGQKTNTVVRYVLARIELLHLLPLVCYLVALTNVQAATNWIPMDVLLVIAALSTNARAALTGM